jgi:hypothetical protein
MPPTGDLSGGRGLVTFRRRASAKQGDKMPGDVADLAELPAIPHRLPTADRLSVRQAVMSRLPPEGARRCSTSLAERTSASHR